MRFLRPAGTLAVRLAYLFLLLAAAARLPGIQDAALSPADAGQLWEAALAAEKYDHPDRALVVLRPLLTAFPQDPSYLSSAARNLNRLNRFAESASAWEEFIRVAPFPTDACPELARAYEAVGDKDKALDAHRRCLAMDPSKSDLKLYLALALERHGQIVEAAERYRAVLEHSPDYSDAKIGLARIKLRQGNFQAADGLSKSVLKTSPANSDALLVAGLVSEKLNHPLEAIALLKKALLVAPGDGDVSQALERLCRYNTSPECPAAAGRKRP